MPMVRFYDLPHGTERVSGDCANATAGGGMCQHQNDSTAEPTRRSNNDFSFFLDAGSSSISQYSCLTLLTLRLTLLTLRSL